MAGAPRAFTLLHKARKVIGGDFVEQPAPEHRQYVAVNDMLAHRAGAAGHLGVRQPLERYIAEVLGCGQPALLTLLLQCRGTASSNGLLGVEQLFAGQSQGDAARAVATDGQGLTAPVETVIVAEGDGTGGRYRHVHPIPVRSLISQ